jgi:hypothetical protein
LNSGILIIRNPEHRNQLRQYVTKYTIVPVYLTLRL